MIPVGTVIDIGDHRVEVLATPEQTDDRYSLRVTAEPGGGPGIDGDDPHIHPKLTETFRCISGSMLALVGSEKRRVGVGELIEVPPNLAHGFVNTGDGPLIVDTDVIFGQGYAPELDLLRFAAIYGSWRRARVAAGEDPEPSGLEMAVLTDAFREAVLPAGWAKALIRPLAIVGRLRGYRPDPPIELDRTV